MGLACPHCGAMYEPDESFCSKCGKAVTGAVSGPRIIGSSGLAGSQVGKELQSQELKKSMNKAFVTLLVVGILQLIIGVVVAALGGLGPGTSGTIAAAMVIGIGVVFLGMAVWARWQPMAAAITGLSVYVLLWIVDIIADPAMAVRGIIMKIVIIGALISAIKAGAQYRKLKQTMAAGGA